MEKDNFFSGVLVLLCSFLVLRFYYNKQGEELGKNHAANNISFWKEIYQLVKNKDLLAISIYAFFLGTVAGAIISHFTLFLYLDYGLAESVAGIGFAFSQFGSILGRPGWGLICDKFLKANRRKAFLFMGFMFACITLFFGLFLKKLNPSLPIIFFFSFLIGCSGRGWDGIFFSSISNMVKKHQVGAAIGFSLLFLRTGILLIPPIFGYIADLRNSYDLSWLVLGSIMLLASVGQYLFYLKQK